AHAHAVPSAPYAVGQRKQCPARVCCVQGSGQRVRASAGKVCAGRKRPTAHAEGEGKRGGREGGRGRPDGVTWLCCVVLSPRPFPSLPLSLLLRRTFSALRQ